MAILPETPRGFWDDFAPIFTRPTFRRFLILVGAAILREILYAALAPAA